MRTTLTLDPDVARMLEEEAARQRKPFKQVVNEAIRRGLAPTAATRSRRRYRVRPHRTALRPGIDALGLNKLADELEDDAVLAKVKRSK
jgi:putative NADH-flavin reductase